MSQFARSLSPNGRPRTAYCAVEAKGGMSWSTAGETALPIWLPADAMASLEPFFSEFLYTHVDLEGLMRGTDMDTIRSTSCGHCTGIDRGRRHHDP